MTPKNIFDTLTVELIDRWLLEEHEENLHLDFKTARAQMDRNDRTNLAIALSGFANSDGGVIVWGVEGKRNARGIDCASKKMPIAPLTLLVSQLNEFTGEGVNPSVDGVLHRGIPDGSDAGYALSYVPATGGGPHMAKAGENRYYKRSGSRFQVMEHFDLADMFGRRPHPELKFWVRLAKGGTTNAGDPVGINKVKVHVFLGISNAGRGTGRAPYLGVTVNKPYDIGRGGLEGEPGASLRPLAQGRGSAFHQFGSAEGVVVHPRSHVEVCSITTLVPEYGSLEYAAMIPDIAITYEIAADGMELIDGTKTVLGVELLRFATARA